MIIYFSATNTSKYVAKKLSDATNEEIIPLKNLVKEKIYKLKIKEGEDIGFVIPTYWEGLPSILIEYLENAEFEIEGNNHYCYFVATYGCDYGNILSTARKAFSKKEPYV